MLKVGLIVRSVRPRVAMAGVELEIQGQNNERLNGVISDIGSSAHAVSHTRSRDVNQP